MKLGERYIPTYLPTYYLGAHICTYLCTPYIHKSGKQHWHLRRHRTDGVAQASNQASQVLG
ncbi:hypothetical protein BO70DRAFT_37141 [Aspergillus heteromorphus CBS 117.55]|uniref:Uncharacterized protein n=1 Tax=Aspergillus heteromorphus CBS 117.55 TaxID=1448321 RepID=A0A317WA53_9EURO|nr:uncharacterized protein BO70DRAFT_37141 [Aspergillus heteromorphus CBS 117.55]PWY82212.1 hypothetical protein BO70DRAFT_37141 [Aspergillus heteromorphus CBS 117.55]